MPKKSDITNQQILQAVSGFKANTDKHLEKVEITTQQILQSLTSLKANTNEHLEKVGVDIQQTLEAMNQFSDHVENKFSQVDQQFDKVDKRFDKVDKRFDFIEQDISRIKNVMVTKNYLDEKMTNLRGDLIVMMRKEDNKLITLVDKLEKKKVISIKAGKTIMAMEPFAKS